MHNVISIHRFLFYYEVTTYKSLCVFLNDHYIDVIMSAMPSQITSLTIIYSNVYPGANQRKHKSSASLVVVRGIHWWPVDSPQKRPVTQKMFPYDALYSTYRQIALHVIPTTWIFQFKRSNIAPNQMKLLLIIIDEFTCGFFITLKILHHPVFKCRFTD